MCKGGGVGGGQSPSADFFMSQAPGNFARAQGVANLPFQPYTGQLTPAVPAAIGQAQTAAQGAANFKPQPINAPQMQAASSGVYGLPQQQGLTMGAQAPQAPAPADASQGLPMPAAPMARPDRGAYTDPRQFRDAMHSFRDQRRNGVGTPPPTPGTPGAPGTGGPAQPSVAAMQGLQGLDAYTNPFQQQVTDRTLSGLDQFRQMALNQNASGAAQSGAFSNDRLGVQNALTNEGFARQAADSLAGLNLQGFNTGAGLLMGDKSSLLQNQQFNAGLQQQAGLANQQAGLTAGIANQGAATDAARINTVGASTLGQLGGLQYGMEGDATNAAYQEFLRQQALPYQQQGLLNSTLSGIPYVYNDPSHPFASAALGYAGKSLGSGLGGGASQAGLQMLGLG